ncbi:MAG: Lrp/AsnC family transcriptional regulator [Candidatus Aenigmarchaeota archaeon]|nr:Lrp/AsnC family transcriptional regulator [Candidatus Aenigmarchaeota archaeon]
MILEKDKKILEILKKNSRKPIKAIALVLGLPVTTVYNRVKYMEEQGIIKQYTLYLDKKKLGYNIEALVEVKITYKSGKESRINETEISKKVLNIPGVERVYVTTGDTDMLVKISVRDIDELNNIVLERLKIIPGIIGTNTSVILANFRN